MKKLMLVILGLALGTSLFAQSCLDDVWQALRNGQAPKAKKFLDECMKSYPDNAQVWLMKGNVYYRLYETDAEKQKADPSYKARFPNAVMEANDAFLQALKLDSKVQPKSGMMGPKLGQRALAYPLYDMGVAAQKAQKFDDAIQYFKLAANNFELGEETSNAALAYYESAVCYLFKKDSKNEIIMLEKAIANGYTSPNAYTELYYLYKDQGDTAKCVNTLNMALTKLPPEQHVLMAEPRMDFYAMVDDSEKLVAVVDEVMAGINAKNPSSPDDTTMITICVTYLNNNKAYAKAETILNDAMAKYPKNFDFISQMGYRYYEEMHDYMDKVKELQNEKRWNDANAINLSPEFKQVKVDAHDWCERAYQVNSDNFDNNRRLRELKVLLQKEVPQELNDKINARMKE